MNASIAALAYLVAGVLFILSRRGLSSPETSRRGNTLGMIGMALAIGVTLLTLGTSGALDPVSYTHLDVYKRQRRHRRFAPKGSHLALESPYGPEP